MSKYFKKDTTKGVIEPVKQNIIQGILDRREKEKKKLPRGLQIDTTTGEKTNITKLAKGGLREWVAQKWVDIGAPKKDGKYQPCGRKKGSKRKYPKCVPLAKATRMTKSQKASAVKRKRAAGNPGGKPTNVATFAKKK